MKNFQFHRPKSVADAVALLRGSGEAKVLAGGQSLLPMLKLDMAQPDELISLGGIAELRAIRVDGKSLLVGALATHDEVARQTTIKGLATMAAGIGDAQVRNRGTVGGAISHADPAADYPAALLALGATVATDRRRIPADSFFTGLFQSALEPDELVTAVHFPVPDRCAYVKFPHRASKYAVVGVMVAKTGSTVRVAVTGAGPVAFRVPDMEAALGKRFAPEALDGITVSAAELSSDSEASADYRAHLIGVMARRAVASA
ncbi:MAG TPA: xanthine dehydrogenase family protein subunit M [Kofleriaceae bacterium]|nr:xanthine dehydrogenase family protein subunit M [Kofleriaceae bacterium]